MSASPALGEADRLTNAMAPDRMPLTSAPGIRGQIMDFQLKGNTQSTEVIREFLPQGSIPSNLFTSPGSQLTWLFPKGARDVHWLEDAMFRVRLQLTGGASPANDITLPYFSNLINRFEIYCNGTLVDTQYPVTYATQRILAETQDEDLGGSGQLHGFNEATTLPDRVIAANGGVQELWLPLRGFFSRDAGGLPWGLAPQHEWKIIVYPEANRFVYAGVPGATVLNVTDFQLRLIGSTWHDQADVNSLMRQFSGDFVKRFFTTPAPIVTNAGAWAANSENRILLTQRDEICSHISFYVKPTSAVANDNVGTQLAGFQFFDPSGQRVLFTDQIADEWHRNYQLPKNYSGRFMTDNAVGQNSNKFHYTVLFTKAAENAIQEGVNYGSYKTTGSDFLAIYPRTTFAGTEQVVIVPYYLRQIRLLGGGGAVLDQVA